MCHIANRWRKTAAGVTIFTRPQLVLLAHQYATACNRVLSLLFFFAFANQIGTRRFVMKLSFREVGLRFDENRLCGKPKKKILPYIYLCTCFVEIYASVTDDQGFGGEHVI